MTEKLLAAYLDDALGGREDVDAVQIKAGGSCEIFRVDRGAAEYVLRRAPKHASSATAHDVLREFRILDAIKDEQIPIPRPLLSCGDPSVFGAPFFLMEMIHGSPVRSSVPEAWAAAPETQGRALDEMIDALARIHLVDWRGCGLDSPAAGPDEFLGRQIGRWLSQLESYGGRDLVEATEVGDWLGRHLPPPQPFALCHGDYKLDNLLFAPEAPPHLRAVVDWEMSAVGDPLVDLSWSLIFHPGPEGTMPLGRAKEPAFVTAGLPSSHTLVDRYSERTGRETAALGWYDVFSRWKLAVVLEGSYAKFQRGQSDNPVHEFFGRQVDLLLISAATIIERGAR